ncbi:MAG: serine/threonine-protein kinase [Myxococcota bacterium]|nr:serine/threonine-protein kinase [Myxococcota bacterium]
MTDRASDGSTIAEAADTVPMTAVDAPSSPSLPASVTPSPDSTQGRRAVAERVGALVLREENEKFRRRLLATTRVGIWIWAGFGLLDAFAVLRGEGPWWVFAAARALPIAIGVFAIAQLKRRRDLGTRTLRGIELSLFGIVAICISIRLSLQGAWITPYTSFLTLLLMTHGMLLGSHWRRSLVPVLAMTASVPLTFGVASLILPEVGALVGEAETWSIFFTFYAPVVGAALISLVAGHSVYQLRAQVSEAKSLGRYRLRRRIARGGMGEIWKAFHAGLQRDVAVKLMQPRLGQDDIAVRRFEREVRTLAELTHPNIVRVFDYGATDAGVWYYAMELLEAKDLTEVIAAEGPMEPARALRLVTQAAEALGEAHARGIVHRDVKPSNLLLVRSGASREFVKLIDFGIAAESGADLTLTATGMIVGTPGYIAPEVITGGEASPAADVYALGMVLYVMLTGTEPFDGGTPNEIIRAALAAPPGPPSAARPGITESVDRLVMRCLARDPAARFADGEELATGLRRVRASLGR